MTPPNAPPSESAESGSDVKSDRRRPPGLILAVVFALGLIYSNWPNGNPPPPVAPQVPVIKSTQQAQNDNPSVDIAATESKEGSGPVIESNQARVNSERLPSADASRTRIEPTRAANPSLSKNPQTKAQPPPKSEDRSRATFIAQVTLKNQDGTVIYQGPIDLQPTLDRIEKGERNEHRNDGTVFQNREGRLDRKPAGYYHEYVVPTPNQRGPGPQRLIVGKGGEVFYTSDHYRSFKKISVP